MSKLNAAVIFGGYSPEHEVSIMSAANVINNMDDGKYNIIPVYISKKGKWFLYEGSLDSIKTPQFEKLIEKTGVPAVFNTNREEPGILRIMGSRVKNVPVDVVFPVLHGCFGEDGTIQGLFEMCGLPYVGSGVLSSAACMDKAFTKLIASSMGISQAKYIAVKESEAADLEALLKTVRYKLGYPVFVKPARAGSSVGVSKAVSKESLKKAILTAFEYDSKILIEKAVLGKELECAVLGDSELSVASGVGRIIPPGEDFYSYDAKYNDEGSITMINADIDDDKKEGIRDYAVKIFNALECRGLARVDFFLVEQTNRVIFSEINTMPGFTNISMYPMLINEMGIDGQKLIDRLIETALNRQ